MKESEVEKRFIWTVMSMGGTSYKFKSVNCRGVSDRIAMLPDGSTWFVELKRPKGGVMSPLQKEFRGVCEKMGQKYCCLSTIEEITNWSICYGRYTDSRGAAC